MFRGKFIAFHTRVRKEGRFEVSNINFHLERRSHKGVFFDRKETNYPESRSVNFVYLVLR